MSAFDDFIGRVLSAEGVQFVAAIIAAVYSLVQLWILARDKILRGK